MTSLESSLDPYYGARDSVLQEVKQLQRIFEDWKSLVMSVDTALDDRFPSLHSKLEVKLQEVFEHASKLSKTVSKVEKHREKFRHVDDAELLSRKRSCQDLKSAIRAIKEAFNSQEYQGKIQRDRKANLKGSSAQGFSGTTNSAPKSSQEGVSQRGINSIMAMQESKIKEQDVVLDDMQSALQRLGVMADHINVELDAQDDMLVDLEDEMDTANDRMEVVMKKLEYIMKVKKRWQIWAILFLAFVLIILILIIGYAL